MYRTSLLSILLIASTCSTMLAQNELTLPVIGRVTDGEAKLEGCLVITYAGNVSVDTIITEKNGKFQTALALNGNYSIVFVMNDMLPKTILIDTSFPYDETDVFFEPMSMDISLLKEEKYAGVDTDVLDLPFALVRFDKGQQAFVQDREYTMDMQRTNGALLLMAARVGKK